MNVRVRAGDGFLRPSFFSSVEKYGEKKKIWSSRFSDSASDELRQLLVDRVEHVALGGDLEQRPGVDLGDLFHYR